MANFGEVTRDFLQFPIYYYDVTYSQSLPVRGIGGAAGVIMNGWDPINLVPSLVHVNAAGELSISGSISASTSGYATAAAPSYVEGTTNALSMDLTGALRVVMAATGGGLTDAQLRATPVPVSGTVTTGGLTDVQLRATPVPVSGTVAVTNANLDVALSTRTKPSDQQHVIIDSSAAITVTGTVAALDPNIDVLLSTRTKPSDQQHVIVDSSASIAVTGTFFQTTQPVSNTYLDVALSTLNENLRASAAATQLNAMFNAQQLALAKSSFGGAGFVPQVEIPQFLAG